MSEPLVYILTVTYNSEAEIEGLLKSLRQDRPQGYRRRIVVVDNASTDKTFDAVRRAKVDAEVICRGANSGYGAANNRAARDALAAGADYVALLNPDVRISPGWLSPLIEVLEKRPDVACVQPRIMLADEPERANSLGNRIHFLGFGYTGGFGQAAPAEGGGLLPCSYASGCACLLRASDFAAAGGFDEWLFLYHEDQDLGWRLRQAGREIVCEPRSVVYHDYRFERDGDKFVHLERNRWAFLLAHFQLRTLLLIAPALALMEIGIWYYCLRSGLGKKKARAVQSLFRKGTREWLCRKRAAVQANRVRSDRDLVDYLDGRLDFGPLQSPAFRRVVDPLLGLYWRFVRRFI